MDLSGFFKLKLTSLFDELVKKARFASSCISYNKELEQEVCKQNQACYCFPYRQTSTTGFQNASQLLMQDRPTYSSSMKALTTRFLRDIPDLINCKTIIYII